MQRVIVFKKGVAVVLDIKQKETLKKELVSCLEGDREIRKIIIFGSFLTSARPVDVDVAVFQDSDEPYLSLAKKYRRQTRPIARRIPLDIIPFRNGVLSDPFLKEIELGETVYER